MAIWTICSIPSLPQRTLNAWSVYEVQLASEKGGWSRHFIGFKQEGCKGQVSSAVRAFDPASGRGITRSGQVYQLQGEPGSDADARAVWSRWKFMNRIDHERDVSDEVYEELRVAGLNP